MLKHFLILLFAALLAGCGKPKQELNIFIWPEFLDAKTVADFEAQFDCRVNLDFYETLEAMMAKLSAGGSSSYDIVVPSQRTLAILVKRGLLAPLRHENIPNFKNLDTQFVNPPFDPGNKFGAPFDWGSTGIYLRMPKDRRIEETWGLIFDPAKQPSPLLLTEDVRSCFAAALRYKGYSVNSTNRKELLEVRDLLLNAKERALGFATSIAGRNAVLAKNAGISIVYSPDAVNGEMEDPETHYFIPREGGELWVDLLSIPAGAPHRDLAEKFINYILDARVGANLANFTHTATANKAAREFIEPNDLNNPAIYPPPDVMPRLEYVIDLGQGNKLYDELWTQIKAK